MESACEKHTIRISVVDLGGWVIGSRNLTLTHPPKSTTLIRMVCFSQADSIGNPYH